jgi:hypothetical protein
MSRTLSYVSTPRETFIGRWRITSVKGWETADIDLLGPAYIEFARRGDGDFQFSAITGDIDYRVSVENEGPVIEWSWAGDDDGTESSGRGWARRDGDTIAGQIFEHGADDFRFEAILANPRRRARHS